MSQTQTRNARPSPLLGERLRAMRLRAKVSLLTLAKATGVDYNTIRALETNPQQQARLAPVVTLARALGCSLDYLVGMSDDPGPGQPTVAPNPLQWKQPWGMLG